MCLCGVVWSIHRFCISSFAFWFYHTSQYIHTWPESPALRIFSRMTSYLILPGTDPSDMVSKAAMRSWESWTLVLRNSIALHRSANEKKPRDSASARRSISWPDSQTDEMDGCWNFNSKPNKQTDRQIKRTR